MRVRTIYRLEEGILAGTEIEPIFAFIGVKYPHRKTKDLYVPPIKTDEKEIKTWHCCQDNCPNPDFEGGLDALIEHLMLHKGRLLKPWTRKHQLQAPLPAVRLPANPWAGEPKEGTNKGVLEERRFCVQLYIDDVKRALEKQGLVIMEGK
jgi:hypothetical protein